MYFGRTSYVSGTETMRTCVKLATVIEMEMICGGMETVRVLLQFQIVLGAHISKLTEKRCGLRMILPENTVKRQIVHF